MEFRNPQFNALGGIDCEINHSALGWIPFTASPGDPEGAAIFHAAKASAAPYVAPAPATPTRAEIQAKRRDAYRIHADPLFFQSQRSGATEQEWLDAVASVKSQYPYPEGEA